MNKVAFRAAFFISAPEITPLVASVRNSSFRPFTSQAGLKLPALTACKYSSPHWLIASTTGAVLFPISVKEYPTFGGTVA
nr:hypothetical protein [Lentibacter algarum]